MTAAHTYRPLLRYVAPGAGRPSGRRDGRDPFGADPDSADTMRPKRMPWGEKEPAA